MYYVFVFFPLGKRTTTTEIGQFALSHLQPAVAVEELSQPSCTSIHQFRTWLMKADVGREERGGKADSFLRCLPRALHRVRYLIECIRFTSITVPGRGGRWGRKSLVFYHCSGFWIQQPGTENAQCVSRPTLTQALLIIPSGHQDLQRFFVSPLPTPHPPRKTLTQIMSHSHMGTADPAR